MIHGKGTTNLPTIINLTKACCLGSPWQIYENSQNSLNKSQATRNQNELSCIQDSPEHEHGETLPNFSWCITEYNREMEEIKILTVEDHTWALQALIHGSAPCNALADQEEAMHHCMQRPNNMDIHAYHNSLTYLNNVELPELPPFAGIS